MMVKTSRQVRMRRPQCGHLEADLLIRSPQLGQYFFCLLFNTAYQYYRLEIRASLKLHPERELQSSRWLCGHCLTEKGRPEVPNEADEIYPVEHVEGIHRQRRLHALIFLLPFTQREITRPA